MEINLSSKKWLISGSYNPHLNSIQNHSVQLSKKIDFYSSKYENLLFWMILMQRWQKLTLKSFFYFLVYNSRSLTKGPTCFKNSEKPTKIDHILTNHSRCFSIPMFLRQDYVTFTNSHQQNSKIIQCRDYKNFTNEDFRRDLLRELSFTNVQPNEFDKFIASKLLNSHALLKEKYIRCNEAAFMKKELRKSIMTRTRLLNKLRKFNCPEKQLAYKKAT